jgi:hypothetical protein
MPRWADHDEDDWDDEDDVEETDLDLDDDETVPCPYCRRPVHEDAERCPHCETYISREDAPPARRPWWFILGFFACLYVIYRWIVWF